MKKLPKKDKRMLKYCGFAFYDLIAENLGYVKEFSTLKKIYEFTHEYLHISDCHIWFHSYLTLVRHYQRKYQFDREFQLWCEDMISNMFHMECRYEIFYKSMLDFHY